MVREHPSFANGGDLEILGPKHACLSCLLRLRGEWPLVDGKNQWCLMCACETDATAEMTLLLCVTTDELTILEDASQLDHEGAALYTCDNPGCTVALCAVCLLRHFGTEAMLAAGQARWGCPICTGLALAPFLPAPPSAVATALVLPTPPAPAPPAPAPPAPAPSAPAPPAAAPPTEPAVKKARVDKPTLAGGSAGSAVSSGSGSSSSGSSSSGSSSSGSASDAE